MKNETHTLYVLTQTPVHIGGEQEKHLVEGMDYLMDGQRVWRLDDRKLANVLGLDTYVNALEGGRNELRNLLRQRKVNYATVATDLGELEGKAKDIKMMVADGMNGLPYIPGSSFKGGLRSALFKAAGGSQRQADDRAVYGQFDNSVMRFLGVSDLHFNHPGMLLNSKVFNPVTQDGNWEGAWKFTFGSGKNKERFEVDEFTTGLQVIPSGELSPLRLNLKPEQLKVFQRATNKPVPRQAAALLKQEDIVNALFQNVYAHTDKYLRKELAYFENLGGHLVNLVVNAYHKLIEANQVERPLLRLGFGSGFHAITGDFQYANHLEPLDRAEGRKLRKSRRLGFDYDETADDYVFHPLGFVQLLRPDDAAPYLEKLRKTPEHHTQKQATTSSPPPAPSASTTTTAASEKAPATVAPKLVTKNAKQLRKGVLVDGIVVGQKGNNVLIRPYLAGYEQATVSLRYPAGIANETLVSITVRLEGKILIGQGTIKPKQI
jgi:hypothetical protein